ncbi:MAG TPA: hypothetical protein VKR83_14195 [Ktedonobacteraceae bacterium]|nr:hypothetical protein [Ktedonobacteraceae bacterium]
MHETLSPLIDRALLDNPRPLEFYLREQSRLPGPRANLRLADDVAHLLAAAVGGRAREVWHVIEYLTRDEKTLKTNTPDEFVVMCGVVASGACAAVYAMWRHEVLARLSEFACNASWRVREAAAIAFQRMLEAAPEETITCLRIWSSEGNCWQQRASIAAIAEPALMHSAAMREAALEMQRVILRRFHAIPLSERKREDVKVLRQATGYTLSVIAAALPEEGFALMCECASWGDSDINWVLRENLKKKRLAKFAAQAEQVAKFLI